MTKQRIEIKMIDNIAARQVAFSKRRKGLFKKAQELSTLSDAEVALVVFSSTGKLFEHTSSSLQQVLERHNNLHSDLDKSYYPSVEQQMRNEVAHKTHELRQLNGEELQGLKFQELMKLEQRLVKGLTRVLKAKDERMANDITGLRKKRMDLMQENRRLSQIRSLADERGQTCNLGRRLTATNVHLFHFFCNNLVYKETTQLQLAISLLIDYWEPYLLHYYWAKMTHGKENTASRRRVLSVFNSTLLASSLMELKMCVCVSLSMPLLIIPYFSFFHFVIKLSLPNSLGFYTVLPFPAMPCSNCFCVNYGPFFSFRFGFDRR